MVKKVRKPLKVYPPPPSARTSCKNPLESVNDAQLSKLDPTGERKALFDYRRNPRSVKPGDILRVTFANGDPFSGLCLSIRLRGVDSAFLLRNQLTRVGVEMWVKVFSPEVQGVEIVQRSEKRKRRARLYYMRFVPSWPRYIGSMDYLLIFYQTTQARYGQCGEYCVQLSQEEVGSYGAACGETVMVSSFFFFFFFFSLSCISIARYVLCYSIRFHLWLYRGHTNIPTIQ